MQKIRGPENILRAVPKAVPQQVKPTDALSSKITAKPTQPQNVKAQSALSEQPQQADSLSKLRQILKDKSKVEKLSDIRGGAEK